LIEASQSEVALFGHALALLGDAFDPVEVTAVFNRQLAHDFARWRPDQSAHAVRSQPDILADLVLVTRHGKSFHTQKEHPSGGVIDRSNGTDAQACSSRGLKGGCPKGLERTQLVGSNFSRERTGFIEHGMTGAGPQGVVVKRRLVMEK
jgi:hypothetical protein